MSALIDKLELKLLTGQKPTSTSFGIGSTFTSIVIPDRLVVETSLNAILPENLIAYEIKAEWSVKGYCKPEHILRAKEDFKSLTRNVIYGEFISSLHELKHLISCDEMEEAYKMVGEIIKEVSR